MNSDGFLYFVVSVLQFSEKLPRHYNLPRCLLLCLNLSDLLRHTTYFLIKLLDRNFTLKRSAFYLRIYANQMVPIAVILVL